MSLDSRSFETKPRSESKPRSIIARYGPWVLLAVAGLGLLSIARTSRISFGPRLAPRTSRRGPRVVVLGAGFAGLTATRKLAQRLAGHARITLVDRHNYHLFTPLLYQVATCGVDPYDVAYPLHQLTGRRGIAMRRSLVTGIDLDAQQVHLSDGDLTYDYLIVALGSTTNFFGNSSASEHALPMKSLGDAVAIRHHVLDALERASVAGPEDRQHLLTFAIVGGGATGVEIAAALADLLHNTVPIDFPAISPAETRIVIIESEGRLLGHLPERMAPLALARLHGLDVEVWLNRKVKEVEPQSLTTEDGQTLRAGTIVWATGVRAPNVVASLQAQHGWGHSLVVDRYLQVEGHPGVYAVGDSAHFVDPSSGTPVPPLAEAAVQEGEVAAENVARAIEGRRQVPFRYRPLGNALSLGRKAGIIQVNGFVFDGLAGWLAWRVVHLAKITSFRNKLATALDWSFGFLYERDTARLELEPTSEEVGHVEPPQSSQPEPDPGLE